MSGLRNQSPAFGAWPFGKNVAFAPGSRASRCVAPAQSPAITGVTTNPFSA